MRQVTKAQSLSGPASSIDGSRGALREAREENDTLRARNDDLRRRCSEMKSEIAQLKAQLADERTERRHYHSLANEIVTRLDIVGRTVDDVVQRAENEVHSTRKEHPGAEVAELKIPAYLNQPIMGYILGKPKAEKRQD
jgi:predicted RNase H-like nuclease (RuvC/YqgF family)